jgi:hypothetical protein
MDFLTRLVQRQRSEPTGLQPVLPSRFEPDGPSQLDVETEYAPPLPTTTARHAPMPVLTAEPEKSTAPATLPPSRPMTVEPPAPLPPVVSAPPDARAHLSDPVPRPATPPPAIQDKSVGPVGFSEQRIADPKIQALQQLSPVTPIPSTAPVEAPARPALPEPLVPVGAVHNPPVIDALAAPEPQPERPTIEISIGRIELVPATPPPEHENTSVAMAPIAPLPSYRPRLSLEDYLLRPNRGRR